MENLILISVVSMIIASLCIILTAITCSVSEAGIARVAIQSMAQQPDESANISKTLFVSMSMVESGSIYGLLLAMILIFSNPFWNYFISMVQK